MWVSGGVESEKRVVCEVEGWARRWVAAHLQQQHHHHDDAAAASSHKARQPQAARRENGGASGALPKPRPPQRHAPGGPRGAGMFGRLARCNAAEQEKHVPAEVAAAEPVSTHALICKLATAVGANKGQAEGRSVRFGRDCCGGRSSEERRVCELVRRSMAQ